MTKPLCVSKGSGPKRPKTKTQGIAQKEGIPEEQARKSKIKIDTTETEDGSKEKKSGREGM
jgi:hypothetical protein